MMVVMIAMAISYAISDANDMMMIRLMLTDG